MQEVRGCQVLLIGTIYQKVGSQGLVGLWTLGIECKMSIMGMSSLFLRSRGAYFPRIKSLVSFKKIKKSCSIASNARLSLSGYVHTLFILVILK